MTTTATETTGATATEGRPAIVPVAEFLRALKNAVVFASPDITTPVIWSVRVRWDGRKVRLESTDRYRIFSEWLRYTEETDTEGPASEGAALVYLDDVKKLIKRLAASDKGEQVRLAAKDGQLLVSTTLFDAVTATYPINAADPAGYPDITKLVEKIEWGSDKTVSPEFSFNPAYFAEVMKIDSGEKNAPIDFNFVNGPEHVVGFRIVRGEESGVDGAIMPIRKAK